MLLLAFSKLVPQRMLVRLHGGQTASGPLSFTQLSIAVPAVAMKQLKDEFMLNVFLFFF